ncbi:MAG: RNA polymerase sigma factor [Deltaproteobacteria bacterium]|nr:RNA polymerase sigma factor [Deltaproteobacteria bacterium]
MGRRSNTNGTGPSHIVEDEALLARQAAAGNPEAFTRIVERYQRPVYNLCLRYIGPSDAEDAAQETFIRAFVHRERFDPRRSLLPWLLTIARHLCIDRIRRVKNSPLSSGEGKISRDPGSSAEEHVACRQEIALLAEGLEELPEGQREAIALFHLDELSYQETAETLDVPVGTIMTWLYRGRAKLREYLQRAQNPRQAIEGGR